MAQHLHAPNAGRTHDVVVEPAELRFTFHRHGRGNQCELTRENQRQRQRQPKRLAEWKEVLVGQPFHTQQSQHERDSQSPEAEPLSGEEMPDVGSESADNVVEPLRRIGVRTELNQADVLVSRTERGENGQGEDERRCQGNQAKNGAGAFVCPKRLDAVEGLE